MTTRTELTPEDYAERVQRIYDRSLRAKMEAALNVARGKFVADGYTVRGPYDLSDDTFRWAITVEGNGLTEAIDVTIEIAESLAYDGSTDGVNVGLSLVEYGGRIVGDLTPYNYTPEVWVDIRDHAGIHERMRIIEGACIGLSSYVTEYREGQK